VLFDSVARSDVDVFKAIALEATAIGIGRALHWSSGAFGQECAEASIRILERGPQVAAAQSNCTSIKKIGRDALAVRDWTTPAN
jgi:isopentenyl diphosphate isomerase/L-lactate dehydrogenase-like FMN-dependent dehydrogenase